MQMVMNVDMNEQLAKFTIEKFCYELEQAGSALIAKVEFLKHADKSAVLSPKMFTRFDHGERGENVVSNLMVVTRVDVDTNVAYHDMTVTVTVTSKNGEPVTLTRTITRGYNG